MLVPCLLAGVGGAGAALAGVAGLISRRKRQQRGWRHRALDTARPTTSTVNESLVALVHGEGSVVCIRQTSKGDAVATLAEFFGGQSWPGRLPAHGQTVCLKSRTTCHRTQKTHPCPAHHTCRHGIPKPGSIRGQAGISAGTCAPDATVVSLAVAARSAKLTVSCSRTWSTCPHKCSSTFLRTGSLGWCWLPAVTGVP